MNQSPESAAGSAAERRGDRPRIAYLTSYDPLNKRSWSGTSCSIAKALQKHCGDITCLGPVTLPETPSLEKFRRRNERLEQFFKKPYDPLHSVFLSKQYAKLFEHRLAVQPFDCVFAPSSSTEVAWVKTRVPIVYLADTTFKRLQDYYPHLADLMRYSAWEGNRIERRAIKKARLLFYSSWWAAESAIRDYRVRQEMVRVVPFGANLDEPPPRDVALGRSVGGGCRLLFVGVDWERKGGELAFETLLGLERMGIPAELSVVGCIPPERFTHAALKVFPYLNKGVPDQEETLIGLFKTADFMLVPTRADCTPVVFCEAAAFGLPVITTDTGGVAGVVEDGENGRLLPPEARGSDYAALIANLLHHPEGYRVLVEGSRRSYEERLNWDAWGVAVRHALLEHGLLGAAGSE